MTTITITEANGLDWDTLHLLELAAKLDECKTVEEFVLKNAILLAEEIVGKDIETLLEEEE